MSLKAKISFFLWERRFALTVTIWGKLMEVEKYIVTPNNKLLSCLVSLSVILFMFINSGCQPQADQNTFIIPPAGAELFQSKCTKCHDPELALQKYRSAEVWLDTITRMKEEHDADVNPEEIELLVKYHVARQKQEAAIFNEKCQKCHPGKIFLEQNLTAEQARSIIKRMQQKAGNTIEDEDVEIIIRYHKQFHQTAMEENLRGVFGQVLGIQPGSMKDEGRKKEMLLFVEKCSTCHEPKRALSVIKDPEVWAQTIKRMQYYSKGQITDQEANKLVDFHVAEQQREINAFKETCTRCHDDKRINSRSKTEEQWLATIKRMQQKAPEWISDEKVTLLAAYFHRRELAMARIFYNRCGLCHFETSGEAVSRSTTQQLNGLIVFANEEYGENLRVTDVNNLLAFHVQRQKRNMQIYENDCLICHSNGLPQKKDPGKTSPGERSRAEWITFIATLQGLELNKEIQNTIDSQIDYHMTKH